MVHLLQLVTHANASVDERRKIGVECWEMAQLRTDLIKDARMEIALDVVLAKLVIVVYAEQALIAVGQKRSYLFFDLTGHLLNHVDIIGRR